MRRAGQKGALAGGEVGQGAGVGGAALPAAAEGGAIVANQLDFFAQAAAQKPRAGVKPAENRQQIFVPPKHRAAGVDVGKLVAEDGIQGLVVIVLFIQQQALSARAAAHHRHWPAQAVRHICFVVGVHRNFAIEAHAVAGAFVQHLIAAQGSRGLHLQFRVFENQGGALPERAAVFLQPASEAQARRNPHDGTDKRARGPKHSDGRLPIEGAQGRNRGRAGGGQAQLGHGLVHPRREQQ